MLDCPDWKPDPIATATAKKVAEEVEELDEISKKTLGSYVKKAAGSAAGISAYYFAVDDGWKLPLLLQLLINKVF